MTDEAARTGPLGRVGLGVAYDGTSFHGFAAQPGQRTVAGALESALVPFRPAGRLVAAGRTDAGVHARAQVVHVDLDGARLDQLAGVRAPGAPLRELGDALNGRLDPDVRIWRTRTMSDGFDARRSALARRYRYNLRTGAPDPLERATHWQIAEDLDVSAMRLAADALVGEHDFAAFCRVPADRPDASLTRRVREVRLHRGERGLVEFEIEANAFCHQMVRSIVGVLVAIGRGRRPAAALNAQLRSRSRAGAPTLAPAHGLCLVAVRYGPEFGGTWSLEESDGADQGLSPTPFARGGVLL